MISVMPVPLLAVIHGDEVNEVIADMNMLFPLAVGLIRCIHINRLRKLSESVWGQFHEGAVAMYPLNKLL